MNKIDVLKLLKELVQDAVLSHTAPDDHSGINTTYYVDQEQLLKNIEAKLEAENPADTACICYVGSLSTETCPVHGAPDVTVSCEGCNRYYTCHRDKKHIACPHCELVKEL